VPLAGGIDMVNCEQVYAAFVSGATVVFADFTATSFCDCASLRCLLAVQRRAAAQGAQLRLVASQAPRAMLTCSSPQAVRNVHLVSRSMGPPGPDPAPAESSRTGPGGAWKLSTPICHRPS